MDSQTDVLKTIKLDNGLLSITLSRPDALNALNATLLEHLLDTFLAAKEDNSIKALLITGTGKAFCAGADINQLAQVNAQGGIKFAQYGQHVFRVLEQLGKPSLAAINGFALGGGCELSMAATMRIASTAAVFGQPEVKLGVIPGFGGTQRLARLVGKGRALEACLTARMIKADEALAWGLVSEVVTPDQLLPRAQAILEGLAKLAPIALKNIMTSIDHGYDLSLDDALAFEAANFGLCCATQDKREGVDAFLEKRAAVFAGE